MLKFRGFKASLNFGYATKSRDDIENYPTGPENISLAGAYKANREEFFGYGSLTDPPKKITPAMVKLPPSRNQQPNLAVQPSKSTSDLATTHTKLPPAILRKSDPDMSTDPRGRTTSESKETTDQVKKEGKKSQSQEQKLLERQQKKQNKIAEEKEAKLKKEQQKTEKEREKLEKVRAKEEAKAAKKDNTKREKKSKSKAPPLPKSAPPTTIDDSLVILDQTPAESQPFPTVNQPKAINQQPEVANQISRTTTQPPKDIQAPPRLKPSLKAEAPQTTKQSPKEVVAPQKATKQPTAPSRQPKPAQRTNPLGQTSQKYSTNTLDSNISRNSGPPPYEEVMPNTNDKAGNTSFGKRIDESDNSWDLVSQHREQMSRPMAKERRPKRMVMDLKFDSGFAQNKENSEV